MNAEDKEEYSRHYKAEKEQGEAFFPYSVVKDAVAALLVFLVLIGLIVAFGIPLESQADPTNAAYVPRPEWYFMFLFELLKYFPGELEFVGVIGIPTVAILALLFLPLMDRSPLRHPLHRPKTITITALALVAIAALTFRAIQSTPVSSSPPTHTLTAAEQAGKRLYQTQNCAACHSLSGVGGTTGPDLAGVGQRRTVQEISAYIANPKSLNPSSIMPSYGEKLSGDEILQIAQFLEATGP